MPKIETKCVTCGSSIFRYPSLINKRNFCSKECFDSNQKNGSILSCFRCDKEFYRRFGEQDIGERVNQFCSKKCYFDHRKEFSKASTYPKEGAIHKHRIVAESVLKRKLLESEVVHHIDRDKKNCSPKNLAVFPSQSLHTRCHFGVMEKEELEKYLLINMEE